MKVNTGYAYNYYMGGKAAGNTADNKTFDKNMAKAGNMPVITFEEPAWMKLKKMLLSHRRALLQRISGI